MQDTLHAMVKNTLDALAILIASLNWAALVAATTSLLTLASLVMSVVWLGIRIYDRVKYGRGLPSSKD